MKKISAVILTAVLLCNLSMVIPVFAGSNSASLTGSSAVRAGDTLTLTFNLDGQGIEGFTANLDYDSSKLTLTGNSQKIASPWKVEITGSDIIVYDDGLSAPINSSTSIFTLTFTVNGSLSTGTNISASIKNILASSGSVDFSVSTATYSATILPPKASNNNLSKLTVSNAEILPAFSASTTSYTTTVAYDISELNVTATPEDSKASVSVTGKSLGIGSNTVNITVTAENGAKKVYTITAKREQDPNYKAGDNAKLSGLTTDAGQLSPAFSADITSYVLYVPFEVTHISLSGTAEDSKTQAVEGASADIVVGNNKLKVIGKAEDGSLKEYTVTVVRMPQYSGTINSGINSDISSLGDSSASKGSPIWLLIIIGILGIGIGAGVTFILMRSKRRY